MLTILAALWYLKQICDAIGKIHENIKAKMVSPNGEMGLFDILAGLAGVQQDDTLAPTCF